MSRLLTLLQKPSKRILGLMSGTSVDGLDMALVHIHGSGHQIQWDVEHFHTLPYSSEWRERILEQMSEETASLSSLAPFHVEFGQFMGECVLKQLKKWDLPVTHVDAIASHGQTVFHQPQKDSNVTLQLGDADQIAAKTGLVTLSDFRMKDIAHHGEGAPLLPYVDALLFQDSVEHRVLHNLGGISNLTYLPATSSNRSVFAFDTGPANMLIDFAMSHFFPGQTYDHNGEHAQKGVAHPLILKELLEHSYFQQPPPKSTGRELFGADFFHQALKQYAHLGLNSYDWIATLTTFTSKSIAHAYQQFLPHIPELNVYFSGGGVHNLTLMQAIQKELGPSVKVHTFEALGMSVDAREAVGFAILGNELLAENPVAFPGITGISKTATLGKISLP